MSIPSEHPSFATLVLHSTASFAAQHAEVHLHRAITYRLTSLSLRLQVQVFGMVFEVPFCYATCAMSLLPSAFFLARSFDIWILGVWLGV